MFKSLPKCRLAYVAVGVAAICGAELTARYIGFGEPPLVMLDDKIEYYLTPGRNYTRFGHDIHRYGMQRRYGQGEHRPPFNLSLFGDSVVYGNRLEQADTLAAQLQKHLGGERDKPESAC